MCEKLLYIKKNSYETYRRELKRVECYSETTTNDH